MTVLLDVLTTGDRFRMSMTDPAEPGRVLTTVVWDGQVVLLEEPGQGPPTRQENVPEDERPATFVMHAGDAAYLRRCPQGRPEGAADVAGRHGTTHRCPAHGTGDARVEEKTLVLDDATGLLLREDSTTERLLATRVEVGVPTDATTFDTDLPPGSSGGASDGSPTLMSSMAQVPRVGGGVLRLADVRRGPSLVVVGDLDGLRDMLPTVLAHTANGTRPRVYGLASVIPSEDWKGSLLNAADEKRFVAEVSAQAGSFPVPVGIDIKGGAAGEELRSFEQLMDGTTVLAAIDADGSLAWRMTDAELAASPQPLIKWSAANG